MLENIFLSHGYFCANHPWEVIVATLTLTICMLTMGGFLVDAESYQWHENFMLKQGTKELDTVVMTAARCLAFFYIYHQFHKLWKLGSKYILGIAGLFAVFSTLVFCSSIVNILRLDFAHLISEAWPFLVLLNDLSKASRLAWLALASSSQKEVRDNIARGMAALGPTLTLDTLVGTLVIGVGTLSGVKHLEMVCCFACMTVIANYLVFMSFFPACLSLVLEISRNREEGRPVYPLSSLTNVLQEEQKPNPVLQRVKVIMSAGLMLVHAHSRWPLLLGYGSKSIPNTLGETGFQQIPLNMAETSLLNSYFERWVNISPDRLVMLILIIALTVKYVFFEQEGISDYVLLSQTNNRELDLNEYRTATSNPRHILQRYSIANFQTKVKQVDTKSVQTEFEDYTNIQSSSKSIKEYAATCSGDTSSSGEMEISKPANDDAIINRPAEIRSVDSCLQILQKSPHQLTDEEVLQLLNGRHIAGYRLEHLLNNPLRGVAIRRYYISEKAKCGKALENLPFQNYDYSQVMDACCENVIGYTPVPVGVAGPLVLDNRVYYVPMATTEGCLIASTNRGCRALSASGGVFSSVVADGMTRGPCVKFSSAQKAGEVKEWLNQEQNFNFIKSSFDSSSRFARLQKLHVNVAARYLFIRFVAQTGDAMGMNMVSKGVEIALADLKSKYFPDMEIVTLSGNFCTDKKPAALNWIEGRGKSVICEATLSGKVVKEVLKTSGQSLVEKNTSKNLVGSAMAASIGGFNAQAANIVTAIYIATGQDPAQNVSSSNCLTLMEITGPTGEDLHVSVTMPSIEIGTVGGGTILPAQAACLEMLGVKGPCNASPGRNANTLARIVCATVLAGELSLMAALCSGDLVSSHMKHNRSTQKEPSPVEKTKQCPKKV